MRNESDVIKLNYLNLWFIKLLIVIMSIKLVNEEVLYIPLLTIIFIEGIFLIIEKKNIKFINVLYIIILILNIILKFKQEYNFVILASLILLLISFGIIRKIENYDMSEMQN